MYIFQDVRQSVKFTSHLTNAILEEKILSDLGNHKNCVPSLSFRDYVTDWFLRRFGSYYVAVPYLKDYIYSVRKLSKYAPRFTILSKLLGYQDVDPNDRSDVAKPKKKLVKISMEDS